MGDALVAPRLERLLAAQTGAAQLRVVDPRLLLLAMGNPAHAHGQGVKDEPELRLLPRQFLLRRLSLGDVAGDAKGANDPPRAIPQGQFRSRHPNLGTVGP